MTCKSCAHIDHGEDCWDEITGNLICGEIGHGVELCKVHALTERLAEALRGEAEGHGCDSSQCPTCCALKEYDSAKAQSGETSAKR